jgi:hypothetical protein
MRAQWSSDLATLTVVVANYTSRSSFSNRALHLKGRRFLGLQSDVLIVLLMQIMIFIVLTVWFFSSTNNNSCYSTHYCWGCKHVITAFWFQCFFTFGILRWPRVEGKYLCSWLMAYWTLPTQFYSSMFWAPKNHEA